MIAFIIFLIIVISTLIFLSRNVIELLISTILIFILSSIILAITGHLLIALIFLIVYAGAILVMISVAYLLTPSKQKIVKSGSMQQKKSVSTQTEEVLSKYFFYCCISIFIITLILIFYELNTFDIQLAPVKEIFKKDNIVSLIYTKTKLKISLDILLLEDLTKEFLTNYSNQHLNQTLGYNLPFSMIFKSLPGPIIFIGLYLYFIILVCLRFFIIMSGSTIIKRQESIDQILKKWKK